MKIAVFIDGANLAYSSRTAGYSIDFKKLKRLFDNPVRLTYYTAILRKPDGDDPLTKVKDFMEYNGYTVVQKESKSYVDPITGLTKVKGNMDIEIAVDMVVASNRFDQIVLFSGDGDFTYAVKECQRRGSTVIVVSTMDLTADELRRQCDEFIDLNSPIMKERLELKRVR